MYNKSKNTVFLKFKKYLFLTLGAFIASVGLEIFLLPNNILDGGIVGVSIITSYLTKMPLGLFTFVLNLPFLFFGYKQIGKTFVITSAYSITLFSIFVSFLHPIPGLTHDVLLATVFGGIILGAGVGIIIRFGGSLDGTEIVAIVFNKQTIFSVGQIVLFLNIIIFSVAALVFGWDRALYSLLTYYIAHKAIDVIISGLDEAKAVIIVSDYGEEIADAIFARLGRGVTFLNGRGGYSKDEKTIIYSVVTRLEISKVRSIIADKDEHAFVTITDVDDVMGGEHKKRAIH